MNELNFNIVDEIIEAVKNAFEESKNIKEKNIKNKELNDIVTDIDLFMEKRIVSFIKERFPAHSIYSEEVYNDEKDSEYQWLIDPIDGTINFAVGLPLFATSIALRKNKETILGIIFDWSANDVYYTIKGKGAFCEGKQIHVSNNRLLKDSVISFCLTSHYNQEHIKQVLNVEENLADKVRGLRLIVSAAIELAWCASGKLEGCLNVKPSIGLSSAAGKLLVQEAGGKVTNLLGNERNEIDTMLVTNGLIHEEIVTVLNDILGIDG